MLSDNPSLQHLPLSQISLHNHSSYSDGSSSLREMCLAGKQAGFHLFGISDHYVHHPKEWGLDWAHSTKNNEDNPHPHVFSMPLQDLPAYMQEFSSLKQELEDENFTLLCGLEVDFFDENFEEIRQELSCYPLDYLIGSCHYAGKMILDYSADLWKELSPLEIEQIWHLYWDKMNRMAATGLFDIIGHADLPKKYNFLPSWDDTEEREKLCRTAAEKKMILELNLQGLRRPCKESFPNLAMLKIARKMGINTILSRDAHTVEQLSLFQPEAEQLLALAGYSPIYGEN